jgi:hypothetical protein
VKAQPRPREVIEKDIELANLAVETAQADLADAQDWLAALELELDELPPEGVDEELWHAHRDPRQQVLL